MVSIQKPATTDRTPTRPAPGSSGTQRTGSGWWWGLLALVPIACCGLPLLLAAGFAAGAGAVLGGAVGVAVLMAAVVLSVVTVRRRATCRTDPGTPEPRRRDRGR